jgi:hypothetical protein
MEKQQNESYTKNRIMAENELYTKSVQEKDLKQKNYMQSNVRQEQLADVVKEKFQLRSDANTQDVINSFLNYAQDKGV